VRRGGLQKQEMRICGGSCGIGLGRIGIGERGRHARPASHGKSERESPQEIAGKRTPVARTLSEMMARGKNKTRSVKR